MRLYFPTSSLNFNDILATESISPKSFYSKRKYGTKRNFTTELALNENLLTLFSVLPMFDLVENPSSEYDEYPIIIEIDFDEVASDNLYKIMENVYVVHETIYLNPKIVRFNFISEDHVKKVITKSKLVEETKLVAKYKENFRFINKNKLSEILIDAAVYPTIDIEDQNSQLVNDKIFNQLKGYIYSYLIKYEENRTYNSLSPILIEMNKIIDVLKEPQNHYFEIARDQLIIAKKYYEKGSQLNEPSKFYYPQIIEYYNRDELQLNKDLLSNFEEFLLYSIIVNYLLNNHESDNILEKRNIEFLLNNLMQIVKSSKKFNLSYFQQIQKMYDRIINRNYQININEISSSVLQNLFVYLLRQDKIEEFDQILKENDIQNSFISYSFLGITTGFSNLSRVISSSVFKNKRLCVEIDKQVHKISEKIWKKSEQSTKQNLVSTNENLYETELFPSNNELDSDILLEIKINDKIQKIRESKVIKRYLNRKNILLRNGVTVLFEELDNDIFIHFNKDTSEYLYIILRNKKNVSNREEQVNFKSRLKQLGYGSNISRVAQGNYPIFFFYKVNRNIDDVLSSKEKNILLENLEHLIEA